MNVNPSCPPETWSGKVLADSLVWIATSTRLKRAWRLSLAAGANAEIPSIPLRNPQVVGTRWLVLVQPLRCRKTQDPP
jgi:hypothetical protein